MKQMKLSKETLSKLKYFSEINSNILLTSDKTLKTVNPSKSLLGQTTIEEDFGVSDGFGIYDLNEFLGVLSLFEDPDLSFSDKFVTIKQGNASIKYFAANKDVLVFPNKDIVFPGATITFNLTEAQVSSIRRAASVLNANFITYEGNGTDINVVIGDYKNATSPSYSTVVGKTDKVFKAIVKIEHYKLIPGDYTVELAVMGEATQRKCISRYTSKENTFYMAVESTSTFDF